MSSPTKRVANIIEQWICDEDISPDRCNDLYMLPSEALPALCYELAEEIMDMLDNDEEAGHGQ